MHEIGHSITIDRHDDTDLVSDPPRLFQNFEVYSGSTDDTTPERLQSNGQDAWSILGSGYERSMTDEGRLDGSFFAFCIEELMSADP